MKEASMEASQKVAKIIEMAVERARERKFDFIMVGLSDEMARLVTGAIREQGRKEEIGPGVSKIGILAEFPKIAVVVNENMTENVAVAGCFWGKNPIRIEGLAAVHLTETEPVACGPADAYLGDRGWHIGEHKPPNKGYQSKWPGD
jgi:hypothetical protein